MVKIGVTVYLKVNYQKKKLNPKKKWRERERESHVQGLFESIIYKPVQSYILKVHVAQNQKSKLVDCDLKSKRGCGMTTRESHV